VAGARPYAWPSAYGDVDNTNYIDDPGLQPPFRLRYALRSDGLFKHPVCATYDDLVYVTLGGFVVCREQATGRTRWRRKLPYQAWTRASLLLGEGKAFISRMFSPRYPKTPDVPSEFYCLDLETGDMVWSREIGVGDRLRCSPTYADGVVAYGSLYDHLSGSPRQIVEAWDADSGRSLWRIALNSSGELLNGPAGCAGNGLMYFTGGGETEPRTGETIAVVPWTGEVMWRTNKAYASQTGTPAYRDGKLYLSGAYQQPVTCLSADTGAVIWQHDSVVDRWHVETTSLGPDYFAINNKYRGGAWRWNLDGTVARSADHPIQLWGPAHGCGAIALASPGYALSATVEGIFAVDCQDGTILWKSPGFGSWTCPNPIASNGRIFYCPQVNGLLFCFEPAR
jgi:outer membrane protein assembly factor BamB